MKKLKLQAAVMGVAACFSLGLQGAANAVPGGDVSVMAHPTGCYDGLYDNGWYMSCTKSNGGQYRAWVRCIPFNGGPKVERDAAVWKSSGLSIVSCPPLTYVETGGQWTRG
ncbi:hypothetical protein [Streptomyces sp. JB150]|uniref:hypothetical protein n=1 Tax=Streptomyces sp. JB150 TaxID=2714844 RepID=UPI001409F136|nr:hypothetical protein [Streptomyces sp. JB150]QIJ65101.1 hypothetical protein G7Z13_26040 [Streptomyces sp. JB150]